MSASDPNSEEELAKTTIDKLWEVRMGQPYGSRSGEKLIVLAESEEQAVARADLAGYSKAHEARPLSKAMWHEDGQCYSRWMWVE